MIKRQESASSASADPFASSVAPSSTGSIASAGDDDDADRNGKDKKYQRHGSVLDSVHRITARNGKRAVASASALVFSVFLIPPLKVMLRHPAATADRTADGLRIPPCPASPWKADENLRGKCPGDLKPYANATTASQCASTCCANEECISWQFRQDVGCIRGKDIRLGMEKDGPAAWCSDHPPHRWHGQFLKPRGKTQGRDPAQIRESACDERTWNPDEEIGQCFGLGDVRRHASGSAEECMRACCGDEKCGAWQWNKEVSWEFVPWMPALHCSVRSVLNVNSDSRPAWLFLWTRYARVPGKGRLNSI
ncbi:hypothetical protein ACHAWF_008535 [Thalassiosira exigua]